MREYGKFPFPYNSTVDEVLSQYPLTDEQKEIVKDRMDKSCPYYSAILYSRAHHEASQYLKEVAVV